MRRILAAIVSVVMAVALPMSAYAKLSESDMYFNGLNGIYFFDDSCGTTASVSELAATGGGYERLKAAVRTYGQYAMGMQKKWGTPWEVVLAQMQKESAVGTAGIAVSGADNNWLGITGTGDAGTYVSGSRNWAKFSSVEASIEAWAGTYVLRNGYYDKAFAYLDPNNYNLEAFLKEMISHYAPSSDGNNEEGYVRDVLSLINGPIAEVRSEMGWLSSGDFAKKNRIGIGGENPIGSEVVGDLTTLAATIGCMNATGGAKLAELAAWMAWDSGAYKNSVKDEYREAMIAVMGYEPGGGYCSKYGGSDRGSLDYYQDCGHFIATVVRYSGYDESFPLTYTVSMRGHMVNSDLWEEISNQGNTDNLMPGDIFVSDDHIMMFIGEYGGDAGNMAQASLCNSTAVMGNIYFNYGGPYRIFRYVGPDNVSGKGELVQL